MTATDSGPQHEGPPRPQSARVLPVNRQRAIEFIRQEIEAAHANGFRARLLVPLTRPQGGPALQFEVELPSLDQLEDFRHRGAGPKQETGEWMHAFSEILITPPAVDILRIDERPA